MSKPITLARIMNALCWRAKKLIQPLRLELAARSLEQRFAANRAGRAHELPGKLVVSLTSYPPRYATLAPTLKALLTQSMKPDHVVLWLYEPEAALLPPEVRDLTSRGLEIRTFPRNIGPLTKILPALTAFPGAFIATADDDIAYRADWLERLVNEWSGKTNEIVCHRAHRIKFSAAGAPAPYAEWRFEVPGPLTSTDIFPTGVGGVLYPPGSLPPETLDEATYQSLCPKQDDLWLYWMGRRAGALYKKTSYNKDLLLWPDSQKVALMDENLYSGGNDVKIAALIGRFGWPSAA